MQDTREGQNNLVTKLANILALLQLRKGTERGGREDCEDFDYSDTYGLESGYFSDNITDIYNEHYYLSEEEKKRMKEPGYLDPSTDWSEACKTYEILQSQRWFDSAMSGEWYKRENQETDIFENSLQPMTTLFDSIRRKRKVEMILYEGIMALDWDFLLFQKLDFIECVKKDVPLLCKSWRSQSRKGSRYGTVKH